MKRHVLCPITLCWCVLFIFFLVCCTTTNAITSPEFTGNYSPCDLESIQAEVITSVDNHMETHELNFVFYPETNTVEMEVRYGSIPIIVRLTQRNRYDLISAMNAYLDSYEVGSVFYGNTEVVMICGFLGLSNNSLSTIHFKNQRMENKKNYFMFCIPPLQDRIHDIQIAFSPVQCIKIIDILDQDSLITIVQELDSVSSLFGSGDL